jgi:SAM-dependent methyltransferase
MATSHNYSGVTYEGNGVKARYCSLCDFVHLEPLPDSSDLADYYRKKFWQDEKAGAYELIANEEGWRRRVYGLYALLLASLVPKGRLYDLGSGHGLFASVMSSAGWETWAVEPSREAGQHAFDWDRDKRAGVLIAAHNTIEGFGMGKGEVDAVSLLWLLEHVPDPASLLRRIHDALKPNGVLLLIVPNEPLRGGPPFVHPTHCNYWDGASMLRLIQRCGFKVPAYWLGTAPMHRFLRTVDYLKHPELGGRLHELVRYTEERLSDKDLFWRMRWYASNGCRDLVLFARKA